MPELMILVKLGISVAFVVSLSLVAEHVSPRVAGVLSGCPLGASIALFFYGLEVGPEFAAESAVYTTAGLTATQVFVFVYHRTTLDVRRAGVAISSATALAAYFLAAWGLHLFSFNRATALLVAVGSVFGFMYLFRSIENSRITEKIRLTRRVILARAGFAAIMILVITGAAKMVGTRWAGLFSAFPVTLYPLILILHLTYGVEHVHTIIRNFPRGLGALITYSMTVSLVYPRWGIGLGTVVSFAAAFLYLVLYSTFSGGMR